MEILFYISGFISIIATLFVILHKNPVHALLYLILSLLSTSCNLFSLRAPFAGAVEIIIYAGAIMVLFMFSVVMLNMNVVLEVDDKEYTFLPFKVCLGVLLLMSSLLIIVLYSVLEVKGIINTVNSMISLKQIGVSLFGPYMLMVEVVSFLLLSALVSVLQISSQKYRFFFDNFIDTSVKEKT